MPKGNSVTCVKPSDPPFLRKLKERVGYKEGPTVDTKREELPVGDARPDLDDEKPVVVVLKPGDLTAEEAEKYAPKEDEGPADEGPADGRIVFKKPDKRKEDSSASPAGSQNKRFKEIDKSNRDKVNSIKDSRLLSFGDEEEEDDEG
ncbi:uncharacterized protein KIAA1143 homolog isoform X2 [Haemaphysalis longicornis]